MMFALFFLIFAFTMKIAKRNWSFYASAIKIVRTNLLNAQTVKFGITENVTAWLNSINICFNRTHINDKYGCEYVLEKAARNSEKSFHSAAVSESIYSKNGKIIRDANLLYEPLQTEKNANQLLKQLGGSFNKRPILTGKCIIFLKAVLCFILCIALVLFVIRIICLSEPISNLLFIYFHKVKKSLAN